MSEDLRSTAQRWDDMYSSREQLFSGNPNGVLVTEAVDLPPGRALDVGCGEGADALWLARHGWQVTAIDVSEIALRRAAATDIEGRVTWSRADLATTSPPAGAFDLVSLQYFPLHRRPGHSAARGLLDAVAPGGTLLFVGHAISGLAPHEQGGFDPADYYQPDDIARLLDTTWEVLINESRHRVVPAPVGTHHTHDTVLRARRRSVNNPATL